ncbi:serine/threonine protein kinase [Actinoplanes friuliensis]|uniref:Serine/threonine protein kinase n=1 Tax=Actinoplanes friuliensis DSM 7358 TaxID=1246995 RepID=U5W1N9_9ACTN|nr:serine/threonine-protein kinase [Actinoplanes friuliensis]AGZ41900.1 Serine/threonine protein kinase [Actinoplanes friuliensis DSM 7358]
MPSLPLRPGDPERLGEYELTARLGAGGMGTVFLGRAPQGRPVAIKVVRSEFVRDEEFLGRFRSEVNRARQVPPFCTAEVLGADLDHDPPYLVVEYVDGPTLTDVIREHGPLSPAGLYSAAIGIATALTAIHGAGVIHRDLKPGNVLFALGGVKVIDFGIARPLEATSAHTRTDQMVGTVAYMAPERFDEAPGPRVSPAADIFAWGAVVTFAGTGRTPFAADSAPATAMRILTQPPSLGDLPMPLRTIVERTLAKEPSERPTARELLDLLLATGSPAALPPRAVPDDPTHVLPQYAAGSTPAGATTAGDGQGLDDPHRPAGQPQAGPVQAGQPQAGAARAGQPQAGQPQPWQPQAGQPHGGQPQGGQPQTWQAPGGQAPGGQAPSGRKGRRKGRVLTTAALALAAAVALGGVVLFSKADSETTGEGRNPATGIGGPSSAPAVSPSASRPAPGPTGNAGVLAGSRKTLIHFVEIDRDLAMPFQDEVIASDGTGKDALFALIPLGVDFLIQSVQPTEGEPPCLGVKIVPDDSAELVATECAGTKATLFSISPTGAKDDKGRPTYTIYNDSYGLVQYYETEKRVYVEQLGDAPPDTTFSFVDRGPL